MRAEILAAAQRENLTANDVKNKFGVLPVTYYSWRKKEGLTGRHDPKPTVTPVRSDGAYARRFQAQVRAMMPRIVREEVARSLGGLLPTNRGRSRKVL